MVEMNAPKLRHLPYALILAALSIGCGKDAGATPAEKATEAPKSRAPKQVELVRAELRDMERTLVVTGSLAAEDQVTVSTKVAGTVASVAVDLGSAVTRGQAIAQLQTTDFQLRVEQAASALSQARALLGLSPDGEEVDVSVEQTSSVKQAQASLDQAKLSLERARSLVEQRLIARAEFDSANTDFVRAQAALDNAREEVRNRLAVMRQRRSELLLARQQLTDTTLRSPLDGIVQAKQTSLGEYLSVGSPVATIVRVNPLRLKVEVPERDASSVRVGQAVRVNVDGQSEHFMGQVARLSPTLSEQSRTLMVEAEIQNPGQLLPGSFVKAEILVGAGARVLTVPSAAVVTFAGIEKVITVEAGKAVEKTIVTGRRTTELTEIVSGLTPEDTVVAKPGNLQHGQPVIVAGS